MKEQISFTEIEYQLRRTTTKREQFLNQMEQLVPWETCVALIEPVYPKGGKGRKPIGVETMLRMFLLQTWFGLSSKGTEEAIYDSYAMKQFMGIRFDEEQVPDATTLRRFRKMLDKNDLLKPLQRTVDEALRLQRRSVRAGSITDAVVLKTSASKNDRGNTAE